MQSPTQPFLVASRNSDCWGGRGGAGDALRDDTRRLVFKNPALNLFSFFLLSHPVVVLSSSVLQQCLAAKITVTSSALSLKLDLIFNFTMSVKRYRATHSYIHIKYIPLLSPASSNLSKRGWWKLSLQNKTLWLVWFPSTPPKATSWAFAKQAPAKSLFLRAL